MLLPEEDQLRPYQNLAKHNVHIRSDFLRLTIDASEHLLKYNDVYRVAKAIGTKRTDKSDCRFPAKRMPVGLLEHMVNFYNADS